jgi:hypothetical protein
MKISFNITRQYTYHYSTLQYISYFGKNADVTVRSVLIVLFVARNMSRCNMPYTWVIKLKVTFTVGTNGNFNVRESLTFDRYSPNKRRLERSVCNEQESRI